MQTPFKCLCFFLCHTDSPEVQKKKKIPPVLSFLCRSCGLLSNQPDPWTQPRSMDPDHMANRVPNRLCHLSLLNKKQTRLGGWSAFLRRLVSSWKASHHHLPVYVVARLVGVPPEGLKLKLNGSFCNSKNLCHKNELITLHSKHFPLTCNPLCEHLRVGASSEQRRQKDNNRQLQSSQETVPHF